MVDVMEEVVEAAVVAHAVDMVAEVAEEVVVAHQFAK